MNIVVIGCGRWGSLIGWYLAAKKGHRVTMYGPADTPDMARFLKERRNNLLELPESIRLATDIHSCAEDDVDVIVISIGCQGLRGLMDELKPLGIKDKTVVLCMKGLEAETGMRLSQIAKEGLDPSVKVAVWVGPGHVQEFYAGRPNCMVIDSEHPEVRTRLVEEFSSELIRFYYGEDLIGNEVGAAAKNVIGIAAGMLDGKGLGSLKGALMSRGTREVARLIAAMGGNELSAYGLCHLGDYEATVFSKFSHNRAFGEAFIKGEDFGALAEGYATTRAMILLGKKHGVDLPICQAVYDILYEHADPDKTLQSLFTRDLKNEFYR